MEFGPISFLKMTSGKYAGVNEKTEVMQKFTLHAALAYVKANPDCGLDSQQAAKIFEGVLMTGIKEMEKESILYKGHEWKLHKTLSGKADCGTDSEGQSKILKSKAKGVEVSTKIEEKPKSKAKNAEYAESQQSGVSTASTNSGKTDLSKAKRDDLLKMCKERGIAESEITIVHGKRGKPINADFLAAINAFDKN